MITLITVYEKVLFGMRACPLPLKLVMSELDPIDHLFLFRVEVLVLKIKDTKLQANAYLFARTLPRDDCVRLVCK